MKAFIQHIPKAELHIHIEGSLEPELMFVIGKRNNIKIPFASVEELHAAYKFSNLQSFLDIYYEGVRVLVHEKDFYDLTWNYLKKISSQNVRHVEIFFDPQAHTIRKIPFETVITGIHKALIDGQKELNLSSKLIICFLRHLDIESCFKTLEQALTFKDWIVGVGLNSAEVGNPPEKFTPLFQKAIKEGFKTVAHAGEEGGPEYIWQAIEKLNVSRIDHGVRCMEDKALVETLIKRQIPLTVCPLSNIKLNVFHSMEEHNLKLMNDCGLCVTINSDDPAYFGGYIAENFIASQTALNLSKNDIYELSKNSFKAAFLNPVEKQYFIKELDEFMANNNNAG